jgi:molybdate transport repressor ModE-like protein
MRDLDIETLRLVVAVASRGSIGAAARELGISQPSASARIREFEARWQLSLLLRSARGSRLTEDGEAVVTWARSVLHEVDQMRAGLTALEVTKNAGVTVAASLTIAEYLVPGWMAALRAGSPELHPHLVVVNSATVVRHIEEGTADLGFIETAARPTGLAGRVIGFDELVVVVSPEHPWARRRKPLTATALRAGEYVLREVGSGTRSTFEDALQAEPSVALEASSTAAVIGAALAGVGPAVTSLRAVRLAVSAGQLVQVPHELDLRRPLTAVWDRDRRLSAAATKLLDIATTALRKAQAEGRRESA